MYDQYIMPRVGNCRSNSLPVLWIKLYWNTVMLIHLHIVYICFHATMTELNSSTNIILTGLLKNKFANPCIMLLVDMYVSKQTFSFITEYQWRTEGLMESRHISFKISKLYIFWQILFPSITGKKNLKTKS